MKPWVVDAKDITLANGADFEERLLLRNNKIDVFLDGQASHENLVVAPKGFGKTLILKARRLRTPRDVRRLPENALVDKPSGSPQSLPTADFGEVRRREAYWQQLWLLAISLSCLKHLGVALALGNATLVKLFADRALLNPCDWFTELLQIPRDAYFSASRQYVSVVLPQFRLVHQPVAIFIDNVDEYFEPHSAVNLSRIDEAALREYWHFAQLGLALASRDLNAVNNHVKIFASIRKEVFQRSIGANALALQLLGSSVEMTYSDEELIDIFEKNILAEPARELVDKKANTALERFLGPANIAYRDATTGEVESFRDFLLRHTLRRPRDIAFIGRGISSVAAADRGAEAVRKVIKEGATRIAETYLGEMQPHLVDFDSSILFKLLAKNAFTKSELSKIATTYTREYNKKHDRRGDGSIHVFCNLYKLGLLGHVGPHPETRRKIQFFKPVGSVALDKERVLPDAEMYVLHPMLDDIVAAANPDYYRRINRFDIVGHGRPWRGEPEVTFVLKGDIRDYGGIMRDPDMAREFPGFFHALIERHKPALAVAESFEGDAVLLCDKSPFALLSAAVAIAAALRESTFARAIRFGGDAGLVKLGGGRRGAIREGFALLRASRAEPLAKPGEILVTEEFKARMITCLHPSALDAFAMTPYRGPRADPDGVVDIAKLDAEQGMPTRLHVVTPKD